MVYRLLFTLLLASAATSSLAHDNEAETIRFTCSIPPEMPQVAVLESYYRDAFAKMGYHFTMDYRPERRSMAETKSGSSHGDCARVIEALNNDELAHVIPVDVIVGQSSMSVWGTQAATLSIENILKPDNTICYVEGNYSSRYWIGRLKELYPTRSPTYFNVPDYATAIRMLTLNRSDYCLGIGVIFEEMLEESGNSGKIHLNTELGLIEARPIIHNHHHQLVEPFTRELSAIVSERGVLGPKSK